MATSMSLSKRPSPVLAGRHRPARRALPVRAFLESQQAPPKDTAGEGGREPVRVGINGFGR